MVNEEKKEEFIKKARAVHGNRYNYSKVEYINSKTKVIIICERHKEFEQTPSGHLKGHGCRKCDVDSRKSNTETFIKKARAVHGDRYNYSEVKYDGLLSQISIICEDHGLFFQTPKCHLSGSGCNDCGRLQSIEGYKNRTIDYDKLTKKFIEKARKIHEDKYNYSKVKYVNSYTKIIIICKIHKEFEQTPSGHLSSKGCPNCGKESRINTLKNIEHVLKKTTEQFIKQARAVHGDLYDYSKTVYKGAQKNVIIICKIHKEFEQLASNHIYNKNGCMDCAIQSKTDTREEFIEKAIKIHGDRYDYSKVDYKNNKTKIEIYCKRHEYYFFQEPHSHLAGRNCYLCGLEKNVHTREQFIENAVNVHGELYDYSKVKYVNSYTNVDIICERHGIFNQTPYSHIRGQGCPSCSNSKGEIIVSNILKKYNINNIRQHSFEDCKNKNPLKFDFYLSDINCIIEFDGEQHFRSVDFFGGEEYFTLIKKRDHIKNTYCKSNNIPILRIKYDETDIEKLIFSFIFFRFSIIY